MGLVNNNNDDIFILTA